MNLNCILKLFQRSGAVAPLILLLMGILSILLGAPDSVAAEEDGKKWKDQAELSVVQTRGNSEVLTIQFKNVLTNNYTERLSSELKTEALYGETDGSANAERYLAEGRMDYKLGSKFSTALKAGWKKDIIGGIFNRYYLGPALVYRFVDGPTHFLKNEIGVDYVLEKYTDQTEDEFASGNFLLAYEWAFAEENKFIQSVALFRDFNVEDNVQIESITGIVSKLNSYFSLKTTYQVNHQTGSV